jgi:hypothetical protein
MIAAMLHWLGAVILGVLAGAAGGAAAQPLVLPGSGGFAPATGEGTVKGESHAWAAVPVSGIGENAAIIHLPPRIAVGHRDRHSDAPDGAVRLAAPLPDMPERIAGWGSTLSMAFAPEPAGRDRLQRRVLTITSQRGPIGGSWVAESEGRRLSPLPPLPGAGSLRGFVGSPVGPVALIEGGAGGEGSAEILVLTGGGWVSLLVPGLSGSGGGEGIGGGGGSRLELVSEPDGVGVWRLGDGRAEVLIGALSVPSAGVVRAAWRPLEVSMRTADGGPAPRPTSGIYRIAGQYVYCAMSGGSGGSLGVWNPTEAGCFRLAEVPEARPPFAAAPLDQVGRLAIVWQEPIPQPPPLREGAPARPPQMKTKVAEVSVFDGAILYNGPANVRGPVSSQEFRLLAMALVGVMVVVMLLVLRPPVVGGPPLSLPPEFTLAEPGWRMLAGVIDVVLAAVAASMVTGAAVWELISVSSLMRDEGSLAGLLVLLGVGFAHGTIGEWLWGRTIGKSLCGCRVARAVMVREEGVGGEGGEIRPALARMTLQASAVRNLVKWALPPVAMAGVSGPERRHRGDIMAGAVVVSRVIRERDAG